MICKRLPFLALLALIAWLPLPLGSNRPWSWALMEAAALSLLGWVLVVQVTRPVALPRALWRARVALLLLGAWLVYQLAHALPIAPHLLASLDPASYRHHAAVARVGLARTATLSIDPGATLDAALRASAFVALLVLVLVLVDSRRRLRVALAVVMFSGLGNALFGLITHFTAGWSGLWHPGSSPGAVSGTYVNRNHFAGLMEMAIAAGVGLVLADLRPGSGRPSWKERARQVSEFLLRRGGRVSFYVLVMCAALILSTSRGGIVALLVALMLTMLLSATAHGRAAREVRLAPAILPVLVLAVAWLGAGDLARKLERSGFESNRSELRAAGYAVVADSPLMGTGPGTFRWVFPAYKRARLGGPFYEHAHNDYLELMIEQGLIGLALLGAGLGHLLLGVVRAFRRRRDPLVRGVLFATLAGGGAMLLHAVVDFNFQIPANAAYFAVLLGLGVAAAAMPSRGGQRSTPAARLAPVPAGK